MPNKQNVLYTIGKEAAETPGTAVPRVAVLPIRDIGSLDRDIIKKEDPLIAGLGMAAGEYPVAGDVKGAIPLSPRPCAGWGHVLKGALGSEGTVSQAIGALRIKYTGSEASCKITTSLSAKTINAKIGALGSEANDTNFGTAGTLTLTDITVDILAELVAVINAYTDYEAYLVTGAGTNAIVSVVDGIFQAKAKWAFLWLTGTGSGAYIHKLTLDLAVDSQRPTYSIQKDGFGDNYLYKGDVMDKLSMKAALKGDVEADLDVLGMTEESGITASSLDAPSGKPYKFGGGFTALGGTKYSGVRNHSISIANNHAQDGYGQDTIDREYHEKGKVVAEAALTLRLDAVSILERAKAELGTKVPMQLLYFEVENTFALGVTALMFIETPYSEISETPKPAANGDALNLDIKLKAFNPGTATDWEPPLTIVLLTSDNAAY